MEYSIVKIKKDFNLYRPGDVIKVSPQMARILIEEDVAERYIREQYQDKD